MYAGSAMDVDHVALLLQCGQGKLHASLKEQRRLEGKVVVSRIKEDFYLGIRLSQRAIIEFNLHIDDVRDPGAYELGHVFVIPNATAHRNTVGHPGDVHESMLALVSNDIRFPQNPVVVQFEILLKNNHKVPP